MLLTKKNLIIGGFVFLLIFSSVIVLFLKPKIDEKKEINKKTVLDLIKEGKSRKCVYNKKVNRQTILEAVFYFSQANFRGDVKTLGPNDSVIDSHFIIKDNFSYVWNNQDPQGFKFNIENQEKVAPVGSDNSEDLNKMANFDCQSKTVDLSLFSLPKDRDFLENF